MFFKIITYFNWGKETTLSLLATAMAVCILAVTMSETVPKDMTVAVSMGTHGTCCLLLCLYFINTSIPFLIF